MILFGDVNLKETVSYVRVINTLVQPYTRGDIQVDALKQPGKEALTMRFELDYLDALEFGKCGPYIPEDNSHLS